MASLAVTEEKFIAVQKENVMWQITVMSLLGSYSDVSITSSLLRNDSSRKETTRFTLDDLAALTGTSSTSYQHQSSSDSHSVSKHFKSP